MFKILVSLTAMLLLTASISYAKSPTDGGSITLGGTISFQNVSGPGISIQQYNISPGFGVFVTSGTLVAINTSFQSITYNDYSYDIFAVSPSLGYFFNLYNNRPEPKGAFYPYFTTQWYFNGGSEVKTNFSYGGSIGCNYMISNAVAADFGIEINFDSIGNQYNRETVFTTLLFLGTRAYIY